MLSRGIVGALTFVLAFCFFSKEATALELKPQDRVVFLGDSITQAGAEPGGYVTLVREAIAKQRPKDGIEVIGAGISGNRVPDLEARLQADVLAKKPSVVVIYIGINDVWHSTSGNGTKREDYDAGLRRIVSSLQKAGSRVVLCTPSVIGERHDGTNPLDNMLDEYCSISRQVATDAGAEMLDLRAAFLSHLEQINSENQDQGLLTGDKVHLNPEGNRFVADLILKSFGLAPGNPAKGGTVRHVVLFKFKSVPEAQIAEVIAAFDQLPSQIKEITGYERGIDISTEDRSKGFTHGFIVTFHDAAGRDTYLTHPSHQAFVEIAGPAIDDVLVFDFQP